VRYVKERQPGGSRITVALLNKEQGAPLNETMVSLGSPQGDLSLFDPRFFRVLPGGRHPVPIPRSIKPRSPLVSIELTLNAQGRVTKATMGLMRVNPDMTRSDPVAVLNLTDASWLAATSTTGPLVYETQNKMQFEVRAKHGDIVDRPIAPSGPGGSNETLTLDVQIPSGSIVKDFSGKYVPVRYSKRQNPRLGGGLFVQITMLNMDSGGPRTESLVRLDIRKQGEENLHDHRYFAVIPGGTEAVPIRGKMNPGNAGIPCVTLDFSLDSGGLIKEGTMGFTRMGADMRLMGFIAAVRFDESALKAAEGTGHTISHYGWKLNVKANRARIIR
jgi:hypothetical protein